MSDAVYSTRGGHAARHTREAARGGKERYSVMMERNNCERITRADEEALGSKDHVAIAIAVAGSTLMGCHVGGMEDKLRSSWENGGEKRWGEWM